MGARFHYSCPNCSTAFDLLEGPGFFVEYEIRFCRTCNCPVSVLTGLVPFCPEEEKVKLQVQVEQDANKCSVCGGNDFEEWPETFPCPNCGAPIEKKGAFLWD